jgi:hypothetical protein
LSEFGYGQLTGFIKTGYNIGTINQEWWVFDGDSIKYEKPLLRPVLGIGAQLITSNNWKFRQEVMFQIKGQGTATPDTRSLFLTSNPDILRFMSFPFSIHRKVINDFWFGIGFQPSLYLSGKDNYEVKENWHGWIYSGILNVQYYINKSIELGFEYDSDFTSYYCVECDSRFYTYRLYGIYHFLEK